MQDHAKAIKWYRIAAGNGDENALSNLNRLTATTNLDHCQNIVSDFGDLMATKGPSVILTLQLTFFLKVSVLLTPMICSIARRNKCSQAIKNQ